MASSSYKTNELGLTTDFYNNLIATFTETAFQANVLELSHYKI
jgi:hypothetical protein